MSQTKIRGALSNGPGKTELRPASTGATVSRLGVVHSEGWLEIELSRFGPIEPHR